MQLHWLCVVATAFLASGTQPDTLDDGDVVKPTQTMKKVVVPEKEMKKPNEPAPKQRTLWRSRAVTWAVAAANSGQSCNDVCNTYPGLICNQATLNGVVGSAAVAAVGADANVNLACDPSYPTIASSFPFNVQGQCGDGSVNGGDTCAQNTVTDMRRYCACTPPGGHGDPHLTNIHGQHFDALREGINTLLQFPRPRTSGGPQENVLRVDASIEHPGNGSKCSGYYFLRLWIQGSLVGEENIVVSSRGWDLTATDALEIKVGNQIMRSDSDVTNFVTNGKYNLTLTDERSIMHSKNVNNRYKYASLLVHLAGIDLKIDWNTGMRRPNSLDFSAKSLKLFGGDWGGILGSDDHSWVATYDPQCKKSKDYDKLAQLVQIEEDWDTDASWGEASL